MNGGNVAAVWVPASGKVSSLRAVVPTLDLVSTLPLAGDQLLYDGSVDGQGTVDLRPVTVLPGASLSQGLVLRDVPLLGSYDYTYALPGSDADSRGPVLATGHFIIINLQKLVL